MEQLKKEYLLKKYKDLVGDDYDLFERALDEASDHAFSQILDADTQFKGKPLTQRKKTYNKELLFAATKSKPDTEMDTPKNYHNDVQKTIEFYEKYKHHVSKPNRENFKSATYYVPDGAFEYVDQVELKDKKKTLLLSGFLGLFGAGSFYLGNYKRGIFQVVISLMLIALIVLASLTNVLVLTMFVAVAVAIALAFRWGSEYDVCKYYIDVINGQRIIEALRSYREPCKSE